MTAPSIIWIDGEPRQPDEPSYFSTDRGATLGDAVFDTCLCLGGQVVWHQDHLHRTQASANVFAHNIDPDLLSEAYRISEQSTSPSVLRVAISRGLGGRGFQLRQDGRSQITATLSALPERIMFSQQSLGIAEIRRNESSPTSIHKTACYLDSIVAQNYAKTQGFEDAIFLNSKGNVTCSTIANLFIVNGSTITTPPTKDGVISGITRKQLIGLAQQLGLKAVEAAVRVQDLSDADEVFVTNSLRLVVPATNMGNGGAKVSKQLALALSENIKQETMTQVRLPKWAID